MILIYLGPRPRPALHPLLGAKVHRCRYVRIRTMVSVQIYPKHDCGKLVSVEAQNMLVNICREAGGRYVLPASISGRSFHVVEPLGIGGYKAQGGYKPHSWS